MYQPISSLQLPEYKIQELQSMGYFYCKDISFNNDVSSKIISAAELASLTEVPATKSAIDCYQEECIAGSITTYSKELDEALGGGIPVGLITEFCGEPGSGKTQICFQLSVNAQLPKWCGGLAGKTLYISTNKGFASHRLQEVAEACVKRYKSIIEKHTPNRSIVNNEFEVDSILKNVHHFSALDYLDLLAVITSLKLWLRKHSPIRLIIIDSITSPFKPLNGVERTQMIYRIFNDLQELSEIYGFAIVVTNDMTTKVDASNSSYQGPSLGGSYDHRINVRIELHKKIGNLIKGSVSKNVLKSPTNIEFNLCS